jgi:hypothetical protein
MAGYRPPFANYMVPNYPIILNMLPEIRQHASDPIMGNLTSQFVSSVQEALFRYRGALSDAVEGSKEALRNPLRVLRSGVQLLVVSPLLVLHWLGVGPRPRVSGGGFLVRLGTAGLTLLTVASALVTLVVGWEEFWRIIRQPF